MLPPRTPLRSVVTLIWMCLQVTKFHHINCQTTQGLVLPEERTTGLACIPEGRTVSYECTVTDTTNPLIGSTVWSGSAFQCQATTNRISLPHSQFNTGVTSMCGNLTAMAVEVDGDNFVSQLSLVASAELNGTSVYCFLSGVTEIGTDVLKIGAFPPPPGPLTIVVSSGSPLNVSWSPPSGPVEGGVGGYMFGVTGEGCGCVSMNVSGNTTSVTCSGWTAAGQTCSFEVRTLSQDCGYFSSAVNKDLLLKALVCDPKELGDNPTSANSSGTATTSNGVIEYNGVELGSTAHIICDNGYTPGINSSNRTCMSNGNWSEMALYCESIPLPSSQPDVTAVTASVLVVIIIIIIVGTTVTVIVFLGFLKRDHNVSPRKFNFKDGPDAPYKISRPIDAVAHKHTAYFRNYRTRTIYKYDSQSNPPSWSILPDCPIKDTSLVIITDASDGTGILHTVGGLLVEGENTRLVGDLYRFNHPWWVKASFPSMEVKRKQVTAVCYAENLIAAGGRGVNGQSTAVEVLNITDNIWSRVADLPQPVFRASGCISKYSLYIVGGQIYDQKRQLQVDVRYAYKASLATLAHSHRGKRGVFKKIKEIPTLRAAFTTFRDRVYAIGGSESDPTTNEAKCSDKLYEYNPENNSWIKLNPLMKRRCYCYAVSLLNKSSDTKQLVVVGGFVTKPDENVTETVEIGEESEKFSTHFETYKKSMPI